MYQFCVNWWPILLLFVQQWAMNMIVENQFFMNNLWNINSKKKGIQFSVKKYVMFFPQLFSYFTCNVLAHLTQKVVWTIAIRFCLLSVFQQTSVYEQCKKSSALKLLGQLERVILSKYTFKILSDDPSFNQTTNMAAVTIK